MIYLDESGARIEDPSFTPPSDAFLYETRRGTFVFRPLTSILTLTAEHPDDPVVAPAADPHRRSRQMTGKYNPRQ